jgi:hypothetical protein
VIGLSFSTIFSAGSIVALPLIVVTWFVIRRPLARQYPPAKV